MSVKQWTFSAIQTNELHLPRSLEGEHHHHHHKCSLLMHKFITPKTNQGFHEGGCGGLNCNWEASVAGFCEPNTKTPGFVELCTVPASSLLSLDVLPALCRPLFVERLKFCTVSRAAARIDNYGFYQRGLSEFCRYSEWLRGRIGEAESVEENFTGTSVTMGAVRVTSYKLHYEIPT